MSSLIVRFAENVYWMGRYLERAENLARILSINETYARADVPEDWQRIFELYGDSTKAAELGVGGTGEVLGYCLFDGENRRSMLSCLSMARENARSVRHLISTEMWTQINVLHSTIREFARTSPEPSSIDAIARDTILGCQAVAGTAAGTLVRGEPWIFYEIGKYLERADQTTRVLDIGFGVELPFDSNAIRWSHTNVLLRSVGGYHAYRAEFPGQSTSRDVALFLLQNTAFPRAVKLCAQEVSGYLHTLLDSHEDVDMIIVFDCLDALVSLLDKSDIMSADASTLNTHLDTIQAALIELSNAVTDVWFAEEKPVRTQIQSQS